MNENPKRKVCHINWFNLFFEKQLIQLLSTEGEHKRDYVLFQHSLFIVWVHLACFLLSSQPEDCWRPTPTSYFLLHMWHFQCEVKSLFKTSGERVFLGYKPVYRYLNGGGRVSCILTNITALLYYLAKHALSDELICALLKVFHCFLLWSQAGAEYAKLLKFLKGVRNGK